MKAIVVDSYGGPEVLKVNRINEPIPRSDQLRIRLHTAGVNPVDTYLRAGSQGYSPKLPFTPGFDGAGEVDTVGDGVKGFSPGERVYVTGTLTGTYGEKCLCSSDQVYPLPRTLTWEEGSCLGVPYFTAWRGLMHHGQAGEGKTVLIHGATGGVGCAAVQLAKALGVRVFGSFGSPAGKKLLESLGVEGTFDHRNPGRFEALMNATEGRGIDIVLEMLANENLNGDIKILAPEGRLIIIGSRGSITITPRDIMAGEGRIIGLKSFRTSPEEKLEAATGIAEAIALNFVKPIIGKVFPLEQASEAHRSVMLKGHQGNIVLKIP